MYSIMRVLISTAVVLTACNAQNQSDSAITIDKTLFEQWRKSPNVLVLDVRTAGEYASGHVEGAINVDYYASDFEEQLNNLPKKDTVLVYCASGRRSSASISSLKKAGFSFIANLEGGYSKYAKQ
ncbi:MAG: rhodanese-like domain-containing protein [Thermaurantimonas sp.]